MLGRRPARWITEVFSPGILVGVLLLLVAWHSTETVAEAATYGLMAAGAASILPLIYILRGVRKGKLSDKHVVVHSQRRMPLLIILVSTAAGTAALALAGAPRELLALIASMVAALLVAVPVTVLARWGISIHSLVAAGAVAALTTVYGPVVSVGWVVVVAVSWARVRLGEHTLLQVLSGAAVGACATGIVFPLLAT
jgi:membrane-associated phospholipid phosphatase